MLRILGLAVALGLAAPGVGWAQSDSMSTNTNVATGFPVTGMYLLIQQGRVVIPNTTGTYDSDPAAQVNCTSVGGCTIVATPSPVGCVMIDGVIRDEESCKDGEPAVVDITEGTHTVKSQFGHTGFRRGNVVIPYFNTYIVYAH